MRHSYNILILNFLFFACGNVDDFKLSHEQLYIRANSAAIDNNQIITSAEEVIDLTADVLADEGISNGRLFGRTSGSSARSCNPSVDHSYLIDRTHYDTTLYIGTMTIDYGNGESCNGDVKRKGKIIDDFEYIVNYKNEIFLSKETIKFDGFIKDSVRIDGKFSINAKTGVPVTLETTKATITYADGRSVDWKGMLNFVPERNEADQHTNMITGTISGITRRNEKFETKIISPLIYNYACENIIDPVPTQGTIDVNLNEQRSTLDYGDGSCDNVYTLTVDGQQTSHQL